MLDIAASIFDYPENMGRLIYPFRESESNREKGLSSIPVDILDTAKEYIFYVDVPGLSKSDIQVTVEGEKTLVIQSNGKRKRDDGDEEGCKYKRLERKASKKIMRKFLLPENSNTAAISAKCENGVLTVTVEKLPPPPKPKTVEVLIA